MWGMGLHCSPTLHFELPSSLVAYVWIETSVGLLCSVLEGKCMEKPVSHIL